MTQNKHQLKGSLRNVYRGMKDRCTNPNNKNYNLYKGKLCQEWYTPKNFFYWATHNGWKNGLTIDRIDGNLGYSPSNCQFITAKENTIKGNKERKLTNIRYKGVDYTYTEFARTFGINVRKVASVMNKLKKEYQIEYKCDDTKEKLLTKGIEDAIFKAGEYFKLRVPLKGEAKIGLNWKETK